MNDLFLHGGNLKAAQALFADAPPQWLDLSTGICPWEYRCDIGYSDLKKLPQYCDIKALEQIAAFYFGTAEDEIIAVSGSDIAIRILGEILRDKPKNLVTPVFSGHQKAFKGAKIIQAGELENIFDEYVIIANPNNPDGRILTPERLCGLMEQNRIKLVVDEAFMDFCPQNSLIKERSGAIILRSFGKFFGLAGLRLGFVIADKDIISRFAQFIGDWPVSSLAVKIGKMAYSDFDWHKKQRGLIAQTSQKMVDLFGDFGLKIIANAGQFITIQTTKAQEIFQTLGQNGILVRPFDYQKDWLRFGLTKNNQEFLRLKNALTKWSSL